MAPDPRGIEQWNLIDQHLRPCSPMAHSRIGVGASIATHCDELRARLARLDPRTAGHLGLVHNWGNEKAKAAAGQASIRWQRFSEWHERRYRELMREDLRARGLNPVW